MSIPSVYNSLIELDPPLFCWAPDCRLKFAVFAEESIVLLAQKSASQITPVVFRHNLGGAVKSSHCRS